MIREWAEGKYGPEIEGRLRKALRQRVILDTSALVDGRVLSLSHEDCLDGIWVVPGFVMLEVQQLADSPEYMTRRKGKRALLIVDQLRKEMAGRDLRFTDISDPDYAGKQVDVALIEMSKRTERSIIITLDHNLAGVAKTAGCRVFDLLGMSATLRPKLLVGDKFPLRLMSRGHTPGQAIGHKDGHMICVRDAADMVGQLIPVVVENIIQTDGGMMAFAKQDYTNGKG